MTPEGRLTQSGLAHELLGCVREHVGARCRADALSGRSCGHEPGCFGAPLLDLVAGFAPDELRMGEHGSNQVVKCPQLDVVFVAVGVVDRTREEVQRVGLLDAVDVDRDLQHGFL